MDTLRASPYLAAMANRLFITFLALLTGLAAQVGPAQARACAASSAEIGAIAAVVSEQRQNITAAFAAPAGKPGIRQTGEVHAVAALYGVLPAPAVLTGIDRARE